MSDRATKVLCFASGRGSEWQAHCLDFDIAVEGASFDDVSKVLEQAIATYVADAHAEAPANQERLLSRRAPIMVRAGWIARFIYAVVLSRTKDTMLRHSFTLPCPASSAPSADS